MAVNTLFFFLTEPSKLELHHFSEAKVQLYQLTKVYSKRISECDKNSEFKTTGGVYWRVYIRQ